MGLFQSLKSHDRTFAPFIRSSLRSLGLINRSNGLHFFRCVSVVRGIRRMQMRNAKQLHHSQRAALDGAPVTFDPKCGIHGNEPALKQAVRAVEEMAANFESQVQAAKAFLLQSSSESKSNLYDHLSECLSKILDERPNNSVDIFESVSQTVKKERYQPEPDTLRDQQTPSERVDLAEKQKGLFEKSDEPADVDGDEEVVIPFPDLLDVARCLESGGIGLGREEMFRINLALKQLTQKEPLVSARFWGKIYGTEANYIIAEVEYTEGEGEEEEEEGGEDGGVSGEGEDEGSRGGEEEGEDGEETKDELPKSQWKPPPVTPKEDPKSGTNKRTYFVCNHPTSGSEEAHCWSKLPHVTPAQIVAARKIRKLLTGRLEAPVMTFPPFPGNETHYLRAQIARITATTQISPAGYFQHPEDEEEEQEDEAGQGIIEPNPEFEITKISELADISNWCHHVPYVLPQGRTVWWNPVQKAEDEFEEEEEEEEEREQPDEPEPETGPPLLISASEDEKVEGMPAWTARLSSNILPQYAVAIASSNLWPGAHTYAAGRKFENVYIGWGLKYSSRPFNPELPPPVQEEFPAGADITETLDPTAEQEKALKAAQEEAQANMEEEEEPEDSDED